MWPKRTLKLPDTDIQIVVRDASSQEADALAKAYADNDWEAVKAKTLALVDSWNLTDPSGKEIPKTPESFDIMPMPAMWYFVIQIQDMYLTGKQSPLLKKNVSGS